MFADLRPLLVVLRRKRAVFLRPMLDFRAKAVKRLDAGKNHDFEVFVGEGEIVGSRVVDILVKIREG